MTHNSKPVLPFGLIMLLTSTTGCAGKIRYPDYYVLELPASVQHVTQTTPFAAAIAVREFSAPDYLREGPIVYRETGNRLGFYEYNHWAVDPRRAVTDAVIREMQSRGTFQSVGRYDGHEPPECMVTGEILHLEEADHKAGVSIEVTLSARMTDSRTAKLLWQDTVSQVTKLDQRSMAGLVGEMSRDLEAAVRRLVSSMESKLNQQLQAVR